MPKKILLSILGIAFFQISFSQVNYLPGLIIKNNGDTLKGLIDYRDWSANPDRINFKVNPGDSPMVYYPTDLMEFRVKDEIYVGGIIETEVSSMKTEKLSDDPQLKLKKDTTFLLTLFKGEKGLYYYSNSDGVKNFYIQQDNGFELLVYKRYMKLVRGKRIVNVNKKYVGQLNIYLDDCPAVKSKINHISYRQNSLTNLFKTYEECSPSSFSYIKQKDKVKAEFGLLAGVSVTDFGFESISPSHEYLVKAGYDLSANVTAGVSLDLLLPRNQRKWSINNELLYTSYHVNGKFDRIESPNEYRITSTEFGYTHLKMNNMFRYTYPVSRVSLFLNAGISNGIVLNETNYKKEETKFYSREEVTEGRAIEETRKYEQGYLLGGGLKYKAFSLEMRYEQAWGIS